MADFHACRISAPRLPVLVPPNALVVMGRRGLGGGGWAGGGTGGGASRGIAGTTVAGSFGTAAQPGVAEDRTAPSVVVTVAGRRLDFVAVGAAVHSLDVEDSFGVLPVACLTLRLPTARGLDLTEWRPGVEVGVSVGFAGTGRRSLGRFLARVVRLSYGGQLVHLRCYGEGILLHSEERRRGWRGLRDSQIAEKLAAEHGLTADVETTDPVREDEVQAGETDAQFLLRLAERNGYAYGVRGGVLTFRPERFKNGGVVLRYRLGDRSTLASFDVEQRPHFLGGGAEGWALNPLTLEEAQESADGGEDDLTKAARSIGLDGFRPAGELATLGGRAPVLRLYDDGPLGTRAELRARVRARADRSHWFVEGVGEAFAAERLEPGTFVRLEGLGTSSGAYLVTRVRYLGGKAARGRPGALSMVFKVRRAWTGKPGASFGDGRLPVAALGGG